MPSQDRPSNTVNSYSSVHDTLSAKNKSYTVKYQQFIIDYAMEWQKVVTERINAGLKKTEVLRRDLDHYQKKVESMRLSVNQALAKGKSVASGTQEKLKRNEEKLISAKQGYNKAATDLCILMEECTERGWRDLHPLLIKCAQFDMTTASEEAKLLGSLSTCVADLKNVATTNGISPQPRLKDLSTLNPEMLSTRPGGVENLQIETGGSGFSLWSGISPTSTNVSPLSPTDPGLPVGGMGGLPIKVAALDPLNPAANSQALTLTGGGGMSATSSVSSYHSGPPAPVGNGDAPLSTLSMLQISNNAAAPPTMNDVYSAQSPSPIGLPPSGGYPRANSITLSDSGIMSPPPGGYPRANSTLSDTGSAYSAGSAYGSLSVASAPAATPPPPPSMPPPPPPTMQQQPMSMNGYGQQVAPPAPGAYQQYAPQPMGAGAYPQTPPPAAQPYPSPRGY